MKIKGYIIAQAIKKQFQGFKGSGSLNDGEEYLKIYDNEESARLFLSKVLLTIKEEMRHSTRVPETLDPDKWLDFCITECEIDVQEDKMIKRGWIIPEKNE